MATDSPGVRVAAAQTAQLKRFAHLHVRAVHSEPVTCFNISPSKVPRDMEGCQRVVYMRDALWWMSLRLVGGKHEQQVEDGCLRREGLDGRIADSIDRVLRIELADE